MDTLSGMAVFAKVVESGSFTAAARELGVSKSSVSKQVSKLEDRLGARLLNRTTRRLNPTEAGTAFYQHAARIVTEAEAAEEAVMNLHTAPRGTLRVNAPMTFGTLHLAQALPAFLSGYPELSIDIDFNDRLVDLVEEGYDVAIRIAKLPDSSLIARKLAPARLALCASQEFWSVHGLPQHPSDLAGYNCLLYTYVSGGNMLYFRGPDGPISVPVKGRIRANNGEALAKAAVGGMGVYLGPTFIIGEQLKNGSLIAALEDYQLPDLSVYAVYPHSRHLSAKVRVFVDFMAAYFGPDPYWDAA
ncbi:MAG: LysR family transcriptional regulator [Rhodospirillales bacterium]|nr:LysR family transcriptional regulator [Rhodospirillales bacterium]